MTLAKTGKIINLALITFLALMSNGCYTYRPFQGAGYGSTISTRTKDGTGSGQHVNMFVSYNGDYSHYFQYGRSYFEDDKIDYLSLVMKSDEEGPEPLPFGSLRVHWSDNSNNGAGFEVGVTSDLIRKKTSGQHREFIVLTAMAQTYLWVGSRDDQLELGAELKVGLEFNYVF